MGKRQGLIFSFETLLVVLFIMITFCGGFYSGSRIVGNYRTEKLKNECTALDRSLEMYARAHQVVLSDTIKTNENTRRLLYDSGKAYPDDLAELGLVQSDFGYFTTKINLAKFSYQKTTAINGKMTYELGVELPNGEYYTSPQSNQ